MIRDLERKREQWRKWYRAHKADNDKKIYFNRAKRKRMFLAWLVEYKASCKCMQCGFSNPAALDFHHREKKHKMFAIAEAVRFTQSIERLKAEIGKCDVLCANCHRIEHYRGVGKRSAT